MHTNRSVRCFCICAAHQMQPTLVIINDKASNFIWPSHVSILLHKLMLQGALSLTNVAIRSPAFGVDDLTCLFHLLCVFVIPVMLLVKGPLKLSYFQCILCLCAGPLQPWALAVHLPVSCPYSWGACIGHGGEAKKCDLGV